MLTAVLIAALSGPTSAMLTTTVAQQDDPAVRIRLNKRDGIDRGDRIRAYARAEDDGYLLVLHADPDGRVRVLFPLDPFDDAYVRGGKEYEVRGRGDRHAFSVYQSSGSGVVYAALFQDPLVTNGLTLGDHWDYTLDRWYLAGDLEGELTMIAQSLAGPGTFEYDLAIYDIGYRVVASDHYGGGLSFYDPYYSDPYWHGHSGFRIHIGFGSFYRYRGYRYWDPFYYDPFYYDPFYYPYGATYIYGPHYVNHFGPRTVVVHEPRHVG